MTIFFSYQSVKKSILYDTKCLKDHANTKGRFVSGHFWSAEHAHLRALAILLTLSTCLMRETDFFLEILMLDVGLFYHNDYFITESYGASLIKTNKSYPDIISRWYICLKIRRVWAWHSGKKLGKNPFSKSRIISTIFLSNLVLFIPRNIMIPFIDILNRTK